MCGLDAGTVNVSHRFGEKPADPDLIKLIDACVQLDGGMEKLNDAMLLMGQFCLPAKPHVDSRESQLRSDVLTLLRSAESPSYSRLNVVCSGYGTDWESGPWSA